MSGNHQQSSALFAEAKERIPGGVNSPVRAFGSVGIDPRFIVRAEGAHLWDADGQQYLDYVGSWGPMILGHSEPTVIEAVVAAAKQGLSYGAPCPMEVEMAEVITRIAPVEMVRMVNSGTEAVMSALRVARGFTGRDKVIKFEGCYHGHSDGMLVKTGSGALTFGVPSSAGVPAGVAQDTLTAEYNNLDSVQQLLEANKDQIAAVIVEPVAANMGVVLPESGFLEGLRSLCDQHGTLLIFDEVITGFRLALGGAQEFFGIQADLVTYGKIIGGGMPVGAYCGRREIMEQVAPCGPVYQAGTLSGNPVAMAAGLAQLKQLEQRPELYNQLERMGGRLANGLREAARKTGVGASVNHIGSLCCAFLTPSPVRSYADAIQADTTRYAAFFRHMLSRGIYLAPSQFEAMFVGALHDAEQIDWTIQEAEQAFAACGQVE